MSKQTLKNLIKKTYSKCLLDSLGEAKTLSELTEHVKYFKDNDSRLRFILKHGEWSFDEFSNLLQKVIKFNNLNESESSIHSIICDRPPRQEYTCSVSAFKSGGDFTKASQLDHTNYEESMDFWKNTRKELQTISEGDYKSNNYIQLQIKSKDSKGWWFFIKENPKCMYIHYYTCDYQTDLGTKKIVKFLEEFVIFNRRYDMCSEIICECKNGDRK
jgi:hypothetical protein